MSSVYRQMAFCVHPDVSGEANATDMMKMVNANKHNPLELIKMAAKWGLDIEIPEKFKRAFEHAKNSKTEKNTFHREESRRVYEAVVNAVVKWHYKYQFKWRIGHGIISKVRKIKKGKFAGYTEWTVLDLVSGKEKKIKRHNTDNHPFIVEKIADSDMIEKAKDLINDNKEIAINRKNDKKKYYAEKFEIFGLEPNTDYTDCGYKVRINYSCGGRTEKLIRTTNFCVYHYSEMMNRVRRTDLKFVISVHKVNTYA